MGFGILMNKVGIKKVKQVKIWLSRVMVLLTAMFIGTSINVKAQVPIDPVAKHTVVDSIVAPWTDWDEVSLNGKLKMAGLPVSPSVKIFMQRDRAIFISLRAPFVGEVGRAEITDSTVLMVNKMKKVYMEESLEKVFSFYPGSLYDLQNLILGRVALPGLGILSHEVEDSVDIYAEEDGTFSLVVAEEAEIPGINYGYVFDSGFWPVALLVLPQQTPDVSVTLGYEYYEHGYDMTVFYRSDTKNYHATLELDEPDWNGRAFDRLSISSKYRKVDLKEFMNSLLR